MLLENVNQNLSYLDKPIDMDEDFEVEVEEECEQMKSVYVDAKLALLSDKGRRKKINQDNGMVGKRKDGTSILVVTDGVSSSINSEKASKLASDCVYNYLNRTNKFSVEVVKSAIQYANNELLGLNDFQKKMDSSQTTIVVAIVKNGKAIIGWVGDSRAYIVEDNCSQLLTEDDSWVNMAKRKGYINSSEAINHPRRHVITQSLGLREGKNLNIHTIEKRMSENQGLLLCTDGLWDYVDKIDGINTQQPIELTLMQYINKANKNGGKDNITVAICLT